MTILLKGDANEDPDLQVVTSENIVGKVTFSIPLVGYLGSLIRTTYGYIFLIVLPAIVLIIFETKNIFKELKKEKPC